MHFSVLDLIVLLLYIALVLFSGWLTSRKKDKDSSSYFLAGKEISWIALSFSIVATETSTLTFLNIPGLSYSGNLAFLGLGLGFVLGRIIVAELFIPMYYKSGFISVYEWVGIRYGKISQKTVTFLFKLTRILGDGVRMYASAIPVAILLKMFLKQYSAMEIVTRNAEILSLLLISGITVLYTVQGGFRSVVWVDSIQFLIYVAGGIFTFFYLGNLLVEKGFNVSDLIQNAFQANKFKIFEWNDFSSAYFAPIAILGGILLTLGTHGVDQMFVQRVLACRSESDAKKAMIFSGVFVFFQFVLFLSIGILLYFYYEGFVIPQDKVFSKFIMEEVPSPITGFLLAAILASAMSTLSSSINSLSLTTKVDLGIDRFGSGTLSLFWGTILLLSSLLPLFLTTGKTGLVELGLSIASYTVGPIIAIFLSGKIRRFSYMQNLKDSFASLSIGLTPVLTLIFGKWTGFGFTLLVPFGIGTCFLIGFSLLRIQNRPISQK
ncbi:transporter, SSS family [Leptospira weilii str. 2006001853]|uniref:Transporter, SSS family n=2 Tax=Leptospira weilii TaxID=28184 RepID=A0A828Z2K5_9LEPT|nr:sodium:solute symporter [Leptospira weilii]EMM70655.1 transporter, SSS family [Leptospira weilii str. 2006001855]EKR63823.1 transporter, SSS family [Leptospira weilii str. 2006001853]MCL8265370.1 sodium:solute symporter [Leptospira weilii]MDL5244856.1 sodium:solute symporter [Leptospira weilii]QDK23505.1 sodium:solute symporter [Leptospira weilii]